MSRSSSALLPLSSHSTSLSMFLLCLLLASSLFPSSAFAQGSKRTSEYDPVQEAEQDSPWTPFHVDAGFAPGESTVTVIGASAPHNIFTYGCETGREILDQFVGAMTGLGHNNIIFPTGPLLIVSPEHAATLAHDGIGKVEIRQAVFEQARIPLARFARRTVEGLRHRRARWFAEVGAWIRLRSARPPIWWTISVSTHSTRPNSWPHFTRRPGCSST